MAWPYGNRSLSPEESLGWEAGFEQYFRNKTLVWEVVYFENRFTDLIDFSASRYNNVGQARTQGVETSGKCGWVRIMQSSGNDLLDQSAVEAVKNAAFRPATRFGQAVDDVKNCSFRFNLTDPGY